MDVRIREAARQDLDLVWAATTETVWNDLPPEERTRLDRKAFEAHFRAQAKRVIDSRRNAIYVAESEEGRVAGYAIVGGASSMLSPMPFGFLYDIWVAPQFRRQGVARRLLQEAERWCRGRGFRTLRLEVGARNAAARALYASAGFQEERVALRKAL
ncbi:MAG: GNAT family N-acetyltransferase [Euryarchaeota archaeon]|nr:GNAT family N-acetyltransferase [Euryarchaeota archaeon]